MSLVQEGKGEEAVYVFFSHPQGILKLLYMNSDMLGLGLMLYGQVLVYSEHYTGVCVISRSSIGPLRQKGQQTQGASRSLCYGHA